VDGLVKQPREVGLVASDLQVKFARERRDFGEIEEQVYGDLGLYFEDPERFDRLVVYVYDDCDTQYPGQYDILAQMETDRVRSAHWLDQGELDSRLSDGLMKAMSPHFTLTRTLVHQYDH
jgi:hypothetical protein